MNNLYVAKDRINSLKRRMARCVCKYCGGPLSLKRITFSDFEEARIEIYCDACERIEFGVEPEIFRSAENFVDATDFNHYPDLEDNARTRRMNVAKVCEILAWGYRNAGLLTADGFTVPLMTESSQMDGTLILTEDELEEVNNERGDY
ncbi:MAG: hypothetical protein UDB11_10855 [Peptococcaceae bacterium]|nr:hypothetical protein [Peptococcaceae bacterium]